VLGFLVLALFLARVTAPRSWRVYALRDGSVRPSVQSPFSAQVSPAVSPPATPPDWHVTAAALADVTGDAAPEWVLVVWRPWRDWPIQRWSPLPSPIEGFHDLSGDSCHLILLDPEDGREIWAGSALPAPLTALAVGDVDGDGRGEVVTLEGDYRSGRGGPATHVNVWRWEGFGFTLLWRSPRAIFWELRLVDVGVDGVRGIAVR
jgi:hypothetical protein